MQAEQEAERVLDLNVPDLRFFAKQHPVVVVRLMTGDQVVGFMWPSPAATDQQLLAEPDNNIRLQFPMVICERISSNGVPFVALERYLPFTPFDNQLAILNSVHVVTLNKADDAFAEYYFNSFIHIQTKIVPGMQESMQQATETLVASNSQFSSELSERITHSGSAAVN